MPTDRQIQQEDYLWKTEPYAHQREAFLRSRDRRAYAYLMEMGTGKTKVTIDVAAWNFKQGRVTCLVVIAPNGVHRNWINKEIREHMPDWTNYRAAVWSSEMRKAERQRVDSLMDPDFDGLRVIAFNIEAFKDSTKCKAGVLVRKLCNAFKVMMVVDESSWIKTPGAKRTRALQVLGKYAACRRILTGTPVTQGPFDLYAQFKFLDWNIIGFDNYYSFSHYFGEWEKEVIRQPHSRGGGFKEIDVIKCYRNIDELNASIDKHSFRITKDECLDLPPKIFQKRYVEMSLTQRKAYNTMVQQSLIELENGEQLFVNNILTKLIRLQQILGGFLPQEEFGEAQPLEKRNIRVETMLDVIEEANGKVIIWARFRPELALIEKTLKEKYGKDSVVSYHGGIEDQDVREENVTKFQDKHSPVRFFVGNPASGGYGITLTAANTVIYYSNDFSYENRLQSEDRCHRIGQHHPVNYIDLECMGTVDTKVLNALEMKMDLAEMITRDAARVAMNKAKADLSGVKYVPPETVSDLLALAPAT